MIKVKITVSSEDTIPEGLMDSIRCCIVDALNEDDGAHIDERSGLAAYEGSDSVVFDAPTEETSEDEEVTEEDNEEGDPDDDGED
jgi:hypothetical protein